MIGKTTRNNVGEFKVNNAGIYKRTALIVFLLAAPAGVIHAVSYFTNIPNLLPFDLKWEDIAINYDEPDYVGIDVRVDWGREWAGKTTEAEIREMIAGVLAVRTEFYRIEFHDLPGEQVDVTFVVGLNSYGPFPPNQMQAGIKSAVIALKMVKGSG